MKYEKGRRKTRSFGDFGRVGKGVTVLMALAGGVLVNAAPPAHYLTSDPAAARTMSHGMASLLVFVLYFLISASTIAKKAASRETWYRRGVRSFVMAVLVLVAYGAVHGVLVVHTEEGAYLSGLWRDRDWIEANASRDWLSWSNKRLFDDTEPGYPYEEIWLARSRIAAYALLQGLYVLGILGLFGAVFFLWAGVYGRPDDDAADCRVK